MSRPWNGLGLCLSLLAILALRTFAAPAPGISMYRPTADPVALISIKSTKLTSSR